MTTAKEYNKGGRPMEFNSAEELEEKVDAYFNSEDAYFQQGDSEPFFAPTMSGLALYLEVDRKTLINYGKKEKFFRTIQKARARVEQAQEMRLYGNNVAGVIFSLKNNFGWADKQEIEMSEKVQDDGSNEW